MMNWPTTRNKLWLHAITLLLIMVSGENLIKRGRLENKRKPKSGEGKTAEALVTEFHGSPLPIGCCSPSRNRSVSTQRFHSRQGHKPPGIRVFDEKELIC